MTSQPLFLQILYITQFRWFLFVSCLEWAIRSEVTLKKGCVIVTNEGQSQYQVASLATITQPFYSFNLLLMTHPNPESFNLATALSILNWCFLCFGNSIFIFFMMHFPSIKFAHWDEMSKTFTNQFLHYVQYKIRPSMEILCDNSVDFR